MKQFNKILILNKDDFFEKKITELYLKLTNKINFNSNQKQVIDILQTVEEQGDLAVEKYTEQFDKVKLNGQFKVPEKDLKKAYEEIEPDLLRSIQKSIKNVKDYQNEIFVKNSINSKIKYTPIKSVGICVPGASAPLASTVIMTAVPALVAGVKNDNIFIVSPPKYNNSVHPLIMAVCYELGIKNVFRIGGAQAVAALSLQSVKKVPTVDKIVGPGNGWVQSAKKIMSFMSVGIDSIAGPSEVLIIADDNANPEWVAADMLSQAEHDSGSSILFTISKKLANNVLIELEKQVHQLNKSDQIIQCLLKFGAIVVFNNINDIINCANKFAIEHLQIQCGNNSKELSNKIINAGAIFIGSYSPVAIGDYIAGPSHTLPTGTTARFSSALTSNDFIKSISIIEYDKEKLFQNSEDVVRLAKSEGLDAHAKSINIRLNRNNHEN